MLQATGAATGSNPRGRRVSIGLRSKIRLNDSGIMAGTVP